MLRLSLILLGAAALLTVGTGASEVQNGARVPVESCTGTPGFGGVVNSLQVDFCPDAEPHCKRYEDMPVEYTLSFNTTTDLKFLFLVASYMDGTTETIVSRWTSSAGWKNGDEVVVRQSMYFMEGVRGNKSIEFKLTAPTVTGTDLEMCLSTNIEVTGLPLSFQQQGNIVGDICPKESVGGPCFFGNSVCDLNEAGTYGECRLGAGHVDPELPPPPVNDGKVHGAPCYNFHAPCAFTGSICAPSPSPFLGFCECNKGYTYEEKSRNGIDVSGCKAGPQFRCFGNDDCVSGAHCLFKNWVGTCTCWPGFQDVEHQCIRLGGHKLGDDCNVNGSPCNFPYSLCSSGSCTCNPLAMEQYGKCKVPSTGQCNANGDCVGFASCVDGSCRCIEGRSENDDGTCA